MEGSSCSNSRMMPSVSSRSNKRCKASRLLDRKLQSRKFQWLHRLKCNRFPSNNNNSLLPFSHNLSKIRLTLTCRLSRLLSLTDPPALLMISLRCKPRACLSRGWQWHLHLLLEETSHLSQVWWTSSSCSTLRTCTTSSSSLCNNNRTSTCICLRLSTSSIITSCLTSTPSHLTSRTSWCSLPTSIIINMNDLSILNGS